MSTLYDEIRSKTEENRCTFGIAQYINLKAGLILEMNRRAGLGEYDATFFKPPLVNNINLSTKRFVLEQIAQDPDFNGFALYFTGDSLFIHWHGKDVDYSSYPEDFC